MHNKVRVIKSVYNQGRNRKSTRQITESRNRPEFVSDLTYWIVFRISKAKLDFVINYVWTMGNLETLPS